MSSSLGRQPNHPSTGTSIYFSQHCFIPLVYFHDCLYPLVWTVLILHLICTVNFLGIWSRQGLINTYWVEWKICNNFFTLSLASFLMLSHKWSWAFRSSTVVCLCSFGLPVYHEVSLRRYCFFYQGLQPSSCMQPYKITLILSHLGPQTP